MKTGPKPTPPLDRFWPKVEKTDGCWNWTAAHLAHGYGLFWNGQRRVLAHRFAYESLVGVIPDGLQIDHLCRNRACVRPDHLEPVTAYVNTVERGQGPSALASRATHCPQGHAYDAANTYAVPGGGRRCRPCNTAAQRIYKQRRRAALAVITHTT